MGLIPGRIKPKTIKAPLGTQYPGLDKQIFPNNYMFFLSFTNYKQMCSCKKVLGSLLSTPNKVGHYCN